MNKFGLPAIVKEIANGSVTWQRIEGLDYGVLGYFLSCHLIIEHYLEQYLKVHYPSLDWNAARLTFGHKISLLSQLKPPDKYDFIAAVKHMNSLRNKLSHNIEFRLGANDLLPITQFLAKIYEDGKGKMPAEPNEILNTFTLVVCAYLAGAITHHLGGS